MSYLREAEVRAKETLEILSLIDNYEHEWGASSRSGLRDNRNSCSMNSKGRQYRIKRKESSHKELRSLFVPNKIKL